MSAAPNAGENDRVVVGVTGTREPLTSKQLAWLRDRLVEYYVPGAELHHGDATGTDAESFEIGRSLGYRTFAHPPLVDRWRAFTESDVILPPRTYLERDADIVYACTVLLAVPKKAEKVTPRSGTWTTVRMARRSERPTRNWWDERPRR